MDKLNNCSEKFVYQRKKSVVDVVWLLFMVCLIFFYLYRVFFAPDTDIFDSILGFLWLIVVVKWTAEIILEYGYAKIEITELGFFYKTFSKFLSWEIRWDDLNGVYSSDQRFEKSLRFILKDSAGKKNRVVEKTKWGDVCDKEASIEQAVAKFINIKDKSLIPHKDLPYNQDLDPAAQNVAIFILGILVVCVLLGLYVYRFYSIGSNIPYWLIILSGCLGGGGTWWYLIKNKVSNVGRTFIVALGIITSVFFTYTLIRSIAVFSGEDKLIAFELEVKNGGYQLWRSSEGEGLVFDLGSVGNSIHTNAEQGDVKLLKVRSGAYNMNFLLPDELDKTRLANN